LNYVSCLHEQGAGFAALGYAQMKRGLGVALVTSGPGSTNIITPVAAAWMDSVPLLVISGQAPTYALVGDTGLRSRGSQEVDIISVVKPITKDAFLLKNKYMAERILHEMITTCLSERQGPAWLDIPLNIQAEICEQ
jgi:acetolactate synthase-1/2/3 large subunit